MCAHTRAGLTWWQLDCSIFQRANPGGCTASQKPAECFCVCLVYYRASPRRRTKDNKVFLCPKSHCWAGVGIVGPLTCLSCLLFLRETSFWISYAGCVWMEGHVPPGPRREKNFFTSSITVDPNKTTWDMRWRAWASFWDGPPNEWFSQLVGFHLSIPKYLQSLGLCSKTKIFHGYTPKFI